MKFQTQLRADDSSSHIDEIKISNSLSRFTGNFKTFFFKDHDQFVLYLPSLNMTGYGDTKLEAKEMLDEVMKDWIDMLLNLTPDLQKVELKKYGWNQELYRKKQFRSKVSVDKNGILRNFELPKDTLIEENNLVF